MFSLSVDLIHFSVPWKEHIEYKPDSDVKILAKKLLIIYLQYVFYEGPRTLQRFYRWTPQREDEKERLQGDDEQGKKTLLVLKNTDTDLVQCSVCKNTYTLYSSFQLIFIRHF